MAALSPLDRARAAVERTGASLALGVAPVRRWLARSRRADIDGRSLDERVAAMLALDDLVGVTDLRGLSPEVARRRVAREIRVADARPVDGVEARDLAYERPGGEGRLRLCEPAGLARPSPGIVYLHGGGWVTGSIETHEALCTAIASGVGARVVSVDYRLAPEHPFPAAADDAVAAFRSIAARAPVLGIDPARIAVAGDSAGGNLSAVVSLETGQDPVRPCLQVLLYPALDGASRLPSTVSLAERYFLTAPMIAWYYDHYTGAAVGPDHPRVSPLRAPDLRGVPRAIVVTCGFDPLRDEGAAYAGRLEAAGVPVTLREEPALPHGFALMRGLVPEAGRATARLIEDFRTALGR